LAGVGAQPVGQQAARRASADDDVVEAVARTARSLFELVDAANDQPTADLLTQRLDVHEKTAWMLRALLED
jgi:DNA-binding ferritin-like protein